MMKNKPDFDENRRMLVDLKLPHIVEQCSSSSTLRIKGGKSYFFPNGDQIEGKYIKFISDTKKEVIDNASTMKLKDINPRFIRFSPYFPECQIIGKYLDFVEIDIVSAYWQSAHDMNLICKTTYLEGLEMPKKIRLMALGAAATAKDIIEFDGSEYTYLGVSYSEAGRRAFFNVAKRIDEVMSYALESMPGMAYFYWVDALFCRLEFHKQAVEIIENFGYKTKTTFLYSFTVDRVTKTVEAQKIVDEKNGLFCFQQKTYFKPRKTKNKWKTF